MLQLPRVNQPVEKDLPSVDTLLEIAQRIVDVAMLMVGARIAEGLATAMPRPLGARLRASPRWPRSRTCVEASTRSRSVHLPSGQPARGSGAML